MRRLKTLAAVLDVPFAELVSLIEQDEAQDEARAG